MEVQTSDLKQVRKAAGLTQAQLAQMTGVSRQTIIATERGDYAPSVYLALRIARSLETTVEEIFSLKEDSPMNSMSDKKKPTNELADRIAGFNDPSMGDERERDVILRAYTLGAVVSTYVFFALGLVFAILGAGMWSALIVLGSMVTSIAVSAYCDRENVDFSMALSRVSPRRLIIGNVVGAVFAIVWVGAVVFHMSEGHPLIDAGMGASTTLGVSTNAYAIVFGAAVGFIVTITLMTISRVRKIKQARAEAAAAADIADVD